MTNATGAGIAPLMDYLERNGTIPAPTTIQALARFSADGTRREIAFEIA